MFRLFAVLFHLGRRRLDTYDEPDVDERRRARSQRMHWSELNSSGIDPANYYAVGSRSEAQLTKFVIQQFAMHKNLKAVTQALSLRGNMSWSQAEQFARQVYIKHRRAIRRRKAPLLLVISLCTIIAGVGMAGYGVAMMVRGLMVVVFALPFPWSGNLLFFGLGIVMILGGLVGVLRLV